MPLLAINRPLCLHFTEPGRFAHSLPPPLPPAEICAVSRISKKEIGRCFKLILKALETSVDLITTGDFMSRFCSNLGLPKQVQMAATFIARKAVELDLVPGRSPISVAAAAIYMASQASAEKKTQKGERSRHSGRRRLTRTLPVTGTLSFVPELRTLGEILYPKFKKSLKSFFFF